MCRCGSRKAVSKSDYQVGGISITTGKPFVLDVRGSDAFDAAWQPYLFSKIGKAGCQRLLHWSFSDDAQFGLINEDNNYKYLSYWVEYCAAAEVSLGRRDARAGHTRSQCDGNLHGRDPGHQEQRWFRGGDDGGPRGACSE